MIHGGKLRIFLFFLTISLFILYGFGIVRNLFLVIISPMIASIIFGVTILVGERNNQNNKYAYYIFHPTRFIKIGVVLGLIFFILLFFAFQCKESFGLLPNFKCFNRLFTNPSDYFGF
jgi:hypothetical protein